MAKLTNLNQATIPNADGPDQALKDFSVKDNNIEVYFRNIKDKLLEKINEADIIVGCVAWLTDSTVLEALSAKTGVSIIVQKEDFLRPDSEKQTKQHLRKLYRNIPGLPDGRYTQFSPSVTITDMSMCTSPELDAIRCCGMHNRNRSVAWPRAHHKFLVFCKQVPMPDSEEMSPSEQYFVRPYAAWTGSYNITNNSINSLENAIYLIHSKIAEAYLQEWGQVAGLSEPLDWTDDWVEPEYRIGT